MRKEGFEPTRLTAPPPQDGASASSADFGKSTSSRRSKICGGNPPDFINFVEVLKGRLRGRMGEGPRRNGAETIGAVERTRTSTLLRASAPQADASANSATTALTQLRLGNPVCQDGFSGVWYVEGGIRTHTPYAATPSRWCICPFRHFRTRMVREY